MAVRRIVANIYAADPTAVRAFYEELLGLKLVTDFGWIQTFASDERQATPQVSVVSEGGSGTQAPDLSIEVDDVNEVYGRAVAAGLEIVQPITDRPWDVRRCFARPVRQDRQHPVALSRSSPSGMAPALTRLSATL